MLNSRWNIGELNETCGRKSIIFSRFFGFLVEKD
jgi:hypothetical protein